MVYEARFLRNDKHVYNTNGFICRSTYGFVSPLTNEEYRILIDKFEGEIHIIKFYLRRDENSSKKYSRLTNLREPRNLVETCLNVLLKNFLDLNPNASFGFIASNCENESLSNTKRFDFYKRMIANLIGEERFAHYTKPEISAYLLVPNSLTNHNRTLTQFNSLLEVAGFADYVD